MKEIRYRQLDDARETLLAAAEAGAKEGRLPPTKLWFSTMEDHEHPTFQAVLQIQRNMMAQQRAVQDQETADAWRNLGDVVVKGAKAASEAAGERRRDMIARGICPTCEGAGKYTESRESKCAVCAGSGVQLGGGGPLKTCIHCGGSGRSINAGPPITRTCASCNGTGKYRKP